MELWSNGVVERGVVEWLEKSSGVVEWSSGGIVN